MWPELPILSWVMSELLSHQIGQTTQPSIIRRKEGVCNHALQIPAASLTSDAPVSQMSSCPGPAQGLPQAAFPQSPPGTSLGLE